MISLFFDPVKIHPCFLAALDLISKAFDEVVSSPSKLSLADSTGLDLDSQRVRAGCPLPQPLLAALRLGAAGKKHVQHLRKIKDRAGLLEALSQVDRRKYDGGRLLVMRRATKIPPRSCFRRRSSLSSLGRPPSLEQWARARPRPPWLSGCGGCCSSSLKARPTMKGDSLVVGAPAARREEMMLLSSPVAKLGCEGRGLRPRMLCGSWSRLLETTHGA